MNAAYSGDISDVIAAPLVDHAEEGLGENVAPSDYGISAYGPDSAKVVEVELSGTGIPKHNNGNADGFYAGIGIPYQVSESVKVARGWGYLSASDVASITDDKWGTSVDADKGPDNTYTSGTDMYSTFYFNIANATKDTVYGKYWHVAVKTGDTVTAIYNVDVSAAKRAYKVTYTAGQTNGTVAVAASATAVEDYQAEGDTVTVTTTPAGSYTTSTVATTPETAVTGSGNTRTFTMPSEDVTAITATFAKGTPAGSDEQGSNAFSVDIDGTPFYYADLSAISADSKVAAGSKVTLVKDNAELSSAQTVSKALDIDLGGKTLKLTGEGVVTFSHDSSAEGAPASSISNGKVVIDAMTSFNTAAIVASGKAKLELASTLTSITSDGPVLSVAGDAEVTSNVPTYTIAQDNAATGAVFTVTDGTFEMPTGTVDNTSSNTGKLKGIVADAATATAEKCNVVLGTENAGGPTFKTLDVPLSFAGESPTAGSAVATIYGGSYTSYTANITPLVVGDYADVTVKSGSFAGTGTGNAVTTNVSGTDATAAKLTIDGGTFVSGTPATMTGTTVSNAGAALLGLNAGTTLKVNGGTFGASGSVYTLFANTLTTKNVLGGSTTQFYTTAAITADQAAAGWAPNSATAAPYGMTKSLSGATLAADAEAITFTGAAQTPTAAQAKFIWAGDGETVLVPGVDYNVGYQYGAYSSTATSSPTVQYAGSYAAVLTPAAGSTYAGTGSTATVTVVPADLDKDAEIYLKLASAPESDPYTKASDFAFPYGTGASASTASVLVQVRIGDTVIQPTVTLNGKTYTNWTTTSLASTGAGSEKGTVTVSATKNSGDDNNSLAFGTATKTAKFNVTGTDLSAATLTLGTTSATYNFAEQTKPTCTVSASGSTVNQSAYTVYVTDPSGSEKALSESTLKDAGTYKFVAKGNASAGYTGETAAVNYTIAQLPMSNVTPVFTGSLESLNSSLATPVNYKVGGLEVAFTTFNYTDSADATKSKSGASYDPTKDFTFSPSAVTGSGTQTIRLTGTQNFSGTKDITFTVNKLSFAAPATLVNPIEGGTPSASVSVEYDGKAHVPALNAVTVNSALNTNLVAGTDYTLSFYAKAGTAADGKPVYSATATAEPTEVNEYKVVVDGVAGSGFDGSKIDVNATTGAAYLTYTITGKAISSPSVSIDVSKVPKAFTGNAVNLYDYVVVKDGDKTLTAKTDYTLFPESITTGETFDLYVYGKGNYSGTSAAQSVERTPAVLSEAAAVDEASIPTDLVYTFDKTGTAQKLDPAIKLKNAETGAELVAGTDYNVQYFKANLDLKGAVKKNSDGSIDYGTTAIAPTSLNQAGSYKAVFTGVGSYGGDEPAVIGADTALYAEFVIDAFDLSVLSVPTAPTVTGAFTFDGTEQKPTVTDIAAKLGTGADQKTVTLASGTDFDVVGQTDAGDYTLEIAGKGNFKNSPELTGDAYKWSIAKLDPKTAASGVTNPVRVEFEVADGVYVSGYTSAPNNSNVKVRVVKETTDAKNPLYTFDAETYTTALGPNTSTAGTGAGQLTVTFAGNPNIEDGVLYSAASTEAWAYNIANATQTLTGATVSTGIAAANGTYGPTYTLQPTTTVNGAAIISDAYLVYKDYAEGDEPTYTIAHGGSQAITAAGTYRIVAYATLGYSGTAEAEFTIEPGDIADQTITYTDAEGATKTYTSASKIAYDYAGGDAIEIANLKVGSLSKYNKATKEGDYTVTYENNTDAGTATATIAGVNNYAGEVVISYTINKVAFDDVFMIYKLDGNTLDKVEDFTYTGSEIKPTVTVTDLAVTKQLTEGVDYELTYNKNKVAGYATVIAVPVSANYSGNVSRGFYIAPADLTSDELDITVKFADAQYTGKALTPDMTITYTAADGTVNELVEGVDYTAPLYANNVDVSEAAQATVVGLTNYTGTLKSTFPVKAAAISDVTLSAKSADYDGAAHQPSVEAVATESGYAPTAEEYDVSYTRGETETTDFTSAGTITVTVTAKEGANISGSKSADFAINPVDFSKAVVKLSSTSFTYNGQAQAPTVDSVTLDGKAVAAADYKATVTAATNAGSYTATVEPTDSNYTGTATATWTIGKAASSVKVADVKATYTGKAVTAAATKTGSSATPEVKYFSDKAATKALAGAPVDAGTYYAKATLAADANYAAAESGVATITIAKAANPVKVKAAKKSYKAKAAKKTVFKAKKAFKVTGNKGGKVTYKKANKAGGKKITVSKKGKVTVKKGLKAGAYKVKVKATAKANKNYNKATKSVTLEVKVAKAKK